MKRYMVCEVIEREHSRPVFCDTLGEARKIMREYIAEVTGNSEEALFAAMYGAKVKLEYGTYVIGNSAEAECYNQNYDWTIFEFDKDEWQRAPVEGRLRAVNIQWDTDGEPVDLPKEIYIPTGMTDMDEIGDYISDETGFCHFGFEVEEV